MTSCSALGQTRQLSPAQMMFSYTVSFIPHILVKQQLIRPMQLMCSANKFHASPGKTFQGKKILFSQVVEEILAMMLAGWVNRVFCSARDSVARISRMRLHKHCNSQGSSLVTPECSDICSPRPSEVSCNLAGVASRSRDRGKAKPRLTASS